MDMEYEVNVKSDHIRQDYRYKIAAIFTGGTIGSKADAEGWIAPDQKQAYELISLFQDKYKDLATQIRFDCHMPYQILSEQLDADHLNLLISEVAKLLESEEQVYDAIIICHGTDTLQYSAAMLDLYFQKTTVPVFLVSSNYPLQDDRANGLCNFYYAVRSIELKKTGVMAVYRNSDGNTYLHEGMKLLAHQTFEDNLYSIHHEHIGYYTQEGVWVEAISENYRNYNSVTIPGIALADSEHKIWKKNQDNNQRGEWKDGLSDIQNDHWSKDKKDIPEERSLQILRRDTSPILWLRMYPGLSYPEINEMIRYIMIESYHSGTIRMDEELKTFLKKAEEREIPVYITGVERLSASYVTIKQYQELHLQPVEHVAPIALYCMLWLQL